MLRLETETLGIAASVLVAISLSMKSMLPLRIVNLVGAIAFMVYAYLIQAWPVFMVNGYVAIIDTYNIYKLLKGGAKC